MYCSSTYDISFKWTLVSMQQSTADTPLRNDGSQLYICKLLSQQAEHSYPETLTWSISEDQHLILHLDFLLKKPAWSLLHCIRGLSVDFL